MTKKDIALKYNKKEYLIIFERNNGYMTMILTGSFCFVSGI